MKIEKIVVGEVIAIFTNKINVRINNNIFECDKKQVSDYPVNLFDFFKVGKIYKFLLINNKDISYKAIRPKLIKNKKYTMPTISDSKNLEKHLLNKLKNMSLK